MSNSTSEEIVLYVLEEIAKKQAEDAGTLHLFPILWAKKYLVARYK